jgi:diguanylate cyclase (GGDEF)-like protein/PAS domain S-box-containing protein
MFSNPSQIALASKLISWIFVVVTSGLLYLLLKHWRETQRIAIQALKSRDNQLIVNLVDSSSDAIYIKDLDGHYLLANQETARVLGRTVQQVLGHDDTDIYPQEQAEMIRSNDSRVIAENQIRTLEETLTTVEGERTYLVTKGPMRDADGQVAGLFGVARDITERKQVEDTLKQSEERLQLVLRGSRDAPWDWNLERGDLYYSPRWWAMLGYEDNELPTGASLWEHIVHPDDGLRVNQAFDQVIKTDSDVYEIEFRLQHKDGHYVPVLSRGFILRDVSGKPVRVSGTNTDLTERKQSEAKIQRLSQLYAAISHCSQAIVHCVNKEELFQQICQDVVTFGGIKMAWIGLIENAGLQVIPVASNGDNSEYLVDINITVDANSPFGQGPTGIAIRENQPVWVQDFVSDARTGPWRERGEKAGWVGTASLPLCCNGVAIGAFNLFTDELNAFDEEIRSLLIAMATDISFALDNFAREIERKQAEIKLHLAANVFTHAREGITITTADGTIIEVNDAFSRITGYSRDEAVGHNPRILGSGRQGREFYVGMWDDLIQKGYWCGEIWNRHKNGEVYAVMQTISAVQDAQGKTQQYVGLFSDITTLKEHESQLEHIAHFDQLTGLPNRVLLADRLRQGMTQAQRRDQKLAVVFLDLDAFKIINDTHGHATGDQLLMTVANRMKLVLREGDTLARLGGDEFVAVLLDLDNTDASESMFNRLIAAAAQPVYINDHELQVTASLGVTFYPQVEDVDADKLLRQADQAMYQAKQEGKNRYQVFDAEQDRNVRGHNENIDRIRRALNDNEFVLYYQPKVNMRDGTVTGAEALIRWQHPEKGLLPPAAFLPLIEEHPLAIEVGEWVIDTALTQIGLWQADGLSLPVSVNIGALQLQQLDFVQSLKAIIDEHPKVKASDLELEILETSALQDVVQVSQIIKACQEFGVNFALDDFGTGYSSLTYLKQLPVTLLKIDQSFVRDMLDDPDDLAILEGVIGLAAAFRREVTAEGVETIEHGTMLLQLGCELAQGYGIARPMPAQDLPNWTSAWKPDAAWVEQAAVSRDDMALVYAAVDHRAWILALTSHIKGERELPPQLNHHHCRFGKWLDAERLDPHGSKSAYKNIEIVHLQVHALAEELLELKNSGHNSEALERMTELYTLRDDLLKKLKHLRA